MKLRKKVQVVIVAMQEPKKVLLLRVNEKRGGFWQNVTGGVDKNESFYDAALRESREETGLPIENISEVIELKSSFEFVDRWHCQVNERCFLIKCNNVWDIIIDPSEHQDFEWKNISTLDPKIVQFASNYQAIQEAINKC